MKKLYSKLILIMILTFSLVAKAGNYKLDADKGSQGNKVDINYATEEEMLTAGVSQRFTDKIIEFREIKGNIEDLKELERIKGIGKKTREKLEKYFKINEIPDPKILYINKADDKTLAYYGFSKKEIKKIREYVGKQDSPIKGIKSSLMLKEAISEEKYNKYCDFIRYNCY